MSDNKKVVEKRICGQLAYTNVTCKAVVSEIRETFFDQVAVKVKIKSGRLLVGQHAIDKNFTVSKVRSLDEFITSMNGEALIAVGDEIDLVANHFDKGYGGEMTAYHTAIETNAFTVNAVLSGNPLFPDIQNFRLRLHKDPTLGDFSEVIETTRDSIEQLARVYRSVMHERICKREGIILAPASAQERIRHKTMGDWTFMDGSEMIHRLYMDENFELTPLTSCTTMNITKRANHITDRGESYVILTDDYRYTLSDDMYITSVSKRTKEFGDE